MIALLARGIAGAFLSAALSFAPASGAAIPHSLPYLKKFQVYPVFLRFW
jgi:hypothetical protein